MVIRYRIKKFLKNAKIQILISILKSLAKLIVGLTTLAASVATCFTVVQMRNERNQSYKPYFVIEPVNYKDEYTKPVFRISDAMNLEDALLVDIEKIPRMSIIISNIGSGTAANIEITFSEQMYEQYWEIACEYYSDKEIQISSDNIEKCSDNVDERTQILHHINKKDLTVYRSYVVSGESMEIPLPEEYHTLFRAIAYCTKGDFYELPDIEFAIDYDDLQGIHYTDNYKLRIHICVDLNASDSVNYAEYVIEPCK